MLRNKITLAGTLREPDHEGAAGVRATPRLDRDVHVGLWTPRGALIFDGRPK